MTNGFKIFMEEEKLVAENEYKIMQVSLKRKTF
jgi:hypothetical protein